MTLVIAFLFSLTLLSCETSNTQAITLVQQSIVELEGATTTIEDWAAAVAGARGSLQWRAGIPAREDVATSLRLVQLDIQRTFKGQAKKATIQWLVNLSTRYIQPTAIEIDGEAQNLLIGFATLELWQWMNLVAPRDDETVPVPNDEQSLLLADQQAEAEAAPKPEVPTPANVVAAAQPDVTLQDHVSGPGTASLSPVYMVVGPLSPGDALNERAAPSAQSAVIDRLAPGTLVTVGERRVVGDTAWREIAGDGGGWVAERYLRPAEFETIGYSLTPVAGSCSGFEPYWFLNWTRTALSVEVDGMREQHPITSVELAQGYTYGLLIAGKNPSNRITFRFEADPCPDLPVDGFMFGRGTLTITRDGKTRWFVGCCTPDSAAVRGTALADTIMQNMQMPPNTKFPFPDGYYCDDTISMDDAILVIEYPNIGYPLADYGCKIDHHSEIDKGFLVEQLCGATEDNRDPKREEHWKLSDKKSVIYVDGTRLRECSY
ncbi:SH3 domain-containing protein [Thiocapsa rosea]|uniref:SH3 domain-containing protein n=1 Tax=Thiocapsa rosea TaxID=69360 RepID=A0A495V1P4_9GAMM|nr:SH3 domain-containing protein [Thiocapsa rosea]RKT43209.1 SH3 domain-containing protein [Thiocapsa rosea]